jgi:hypothetical protein
MLRIDAQACGSRYDLYLARTLSSIWFGPVLPSISGWIGYSGLGAGKPAVSGGGGGVVFSCLCISPPKSQV